MKITVAVAEHCPHCGGRLGCSSEGCAPRPGGNVLARARAAYEAYGNATGGKNYQGLPMPRWDDLGDAIQYAWVCAGIVAASAAGTANVTAAQRWTLLELRRAQRAMLDGWGETPDGAGRTDLWAALHEAADRAWETFALELGG